MHTHFLRVRKRHWMAQICFLNLMRLLWTEKTSFRGSGTSHEHNKRHSDYQKPTMNSIDILSDGQKPIVNAKNDYLSIKHRLCIVHTSFLRVRNSFLSISATSWTSETTFLLTDFLSLGQEQIINDAKVFLNGRKCTI